MTLFDWIPAGVLALILWLGRNLVVTRLRASVQHEFDGKIENLRSALRSREAEIITIRESLLKATSAHQAAIDARKLQAIDAVWKGMLALRKAGAGTAAMLAPLKVEAVVKELHKENVREFISTVFDKTPSVGVFSEDADIREAEWARPYLPPIVWAIFLAYHVVVGYVIAQASTLKLGQDPGKFFESARIPELVNLALENSKFPKMRFFENAVLPSVLQSLEARLLEELRLSVSGADADESSAERARRAITLAADIARDADKAKAGAAP